MTAEEMVARYERVADEFDRRLQPLAGDLHPHATGGDPMARRMAIAQVARQDPATATALCLEMLAMLLGF
jgi:hypothetical protein